MNLTVILIVGGLIVSTALIIETWAFIAFRPHLTHIKNSPNTNCTTNSVF